MACATICPGCLPGCLGPIRHGTLTISYGDERVTLDPTIPYDEFRANVARSEALIRKIEVEGMGRQFARIAELPVPKGRTG